MSELHDWRALRLFNLYRMVLSGLLVTLNLLPAVQFSAGLWLPDLFNIVALLYLVFSLSLSFTIRARELPRQLLFRMQIATDILALSVLGFASGHPTQIFGVLMLVPVAFASIWQPGLMAQFYAALAILGMLGATLTQFWMGEISYPYAGLGALSAAQLSIALLSGLVGKRVDSSLELARNRAADIASLTELNAYIVQRMEEGVVVVDGEDRIRLINPAARRLLDREGAGVENKPLHVLSPLMAELLHGWRRGEAVDSRRLAPLHLMITTLGHSRDGQVLLVLENMQDQDSRAQREKLAALGRLTASLAHEIRNPLGAISQAGQLLAEDDDLSDQNRRLLDIIRNQSMRLNHYIEEILTLSRRKVPAFSDIALDSWLQGLVAEWALSWPQLSEWLNYSALSSEDKGGLTVRADSQHLRQLLTILLDNALKHAQPVSGALSIDLRLTRLPPAETPCIEICDNGQGIEPALRQQIFEPFFSTSAEGTGLGLYLARELSEANYCELSYSAARSGGSCFRITFPMERPMTNHSQ